MAWKIGSWYWLDRCPPLDGGDAKRRPIILVWDDSLPYGPPPGFQWFVAATTADDVDFTVDPDAVLIEDDLPELSWALPRWLLEVATWQVGECQGRISAALIEEIVDGVVNRSWDPDYLPPPA